MTNPYIQRWSTSGDLSAPVLSGYKLGRLIRQDREDDRKRNALAEAFRAAYQPEVQGTPGVVGYGGEEYEPVEPVQAQPPTFNINNAIAQLYKGGYGPEAFELQSKSQQNEIANLLKMAQAKKAMTPEAPTTRKVLIGEEEVTQEFTPSGWKEVGRGKKQPLVNIDNKAEAAGLKKLSEEEAQLVSELKKNAIAGTKLMGPLTRMEQLNETGNVVQGPLANFNQELGKFALYLGAGDEVKKRVAAGEQYFSAAADVVREKIRALGAGNAISNIDLLFTRESIGALTSSQTGRSLIIKAMKQDIENIQRLSQGADKHFRGPGRGSLSGFDPQQHVKILPELSGANATEPEVTAVNPQTGQRIILRNGQWQPL